MKQATCTVLNALPRHMLPVFGFLAVCGWGLLKLAAMLETMRGAV